MQATNEMNALVFLFEVHPRPQPTGSIHQGAAAQNFKMVLGRLGVKSPHYRAAALMSASPSISRP
jgi:hypothetical protein